VIFTQFVDDDLRCASYLVGDENAGVAVVVDPAYAIEQYLEEAERRGVRITRVLETHTHADHVSGHGRLVLENDLPISIHPAAKVDYPFDPLADGEDVEVGEIALRCIHTPGHRPEHCCFAVIDHSRADEPWLLLTGDSLFVGDVARPDLAVEAREGAEGLFHSLRRLLELPDGVEVYPGHVAGSLCGKSMSSKASTTIGFERRFNSVVAISELDAFITESASIAAPKPPNSERIVELNRGTLLGRAADPEEQAVPPQDAQLLDVRPVADFMAGHRHGAINIPVAGSSFATKAGFLLESDRSVCILASDEAEAERATRGLRSVGVLDVPAFVLGGGDERLAAVSVDELEDLLDDGADVIDVREKDERDDGYIAGTRNIPYRLVGEVADDVPTDRLVITVCESGARAAVAASVLAARGVDAHPVVDGGIGAWLASGRQLTHFRRCGS
jgi:hydroxyacylglutathione hydrolase